VVIRRWGVLGAAVAVAALSAISASPALFAVAVGMVFLVAAGWAGLALGTRCVRAERMIGPSEVLEGAPIGVRFAVAGVTWLPVTVEVEDHQGGWTPVAFGRASVEFCVGRPGAYRLAPSRLRVRDTAGMFERRLTAGRAEPLLILPAPLTSSPRVPTRHGLTDDLEPHGLRPYVAGAPLTRVHWPSLARGAGLHVRHVAAPPDELPLVVVDTAGAPNDAALHWVARTAAGHVLTLARDGGCSVLLPGDRTATIVSGPGDEWRAVHRRLASLGSAHSGVLASRAADAAAVHVSAAAAPSAPVPVTPLPRGVVAEVR
jgi:uncharacterized protein (DUF58 family)